MGYKINLRGASDYANILKDLYIELDNTNWAADNLHGFLDEISTDIDTKESRQVIKTLLDYTAEPFDMVLVDTTDNVTVTLPASASQGDVVYISDVTGNAKNRIITIDGNGLNISGQDQDIVIDVALGSVNLIYDNASNGWHVDAGGSYFGADNSDVDDAFLTLNADFTTGTPTENGGLIVSRGDEELDTILRWNETTDVWELTNDGTTFNTIITGTGSGVDHGNLQGLGDDDHSQYVHNTIDRTITADHTFDPTVQGAPFEIGANADRQLVEGLNAEFMNSIKPWSITESAPAGTTGGDLWFQFVSEVLELLTNLTAPTPGAYDYFGSRVAISGNGERAVVGMWSQTAVSATIGSAFVYKLNTSTSTWELEQEIVPAGIVKADDYGYAVTISDDGTRILVGAPEDGTSRGVVYLWTWNGSAWVNSQTIVPADNRDYDKFGWSCEFTSDGSKCIIGSTGNQPYTQYVYQGAAYIWSWNGSAYVEEGKVSSPTVVTNDVFGYRVDISDDGTQVVVGAPFVNDTNGDQAGAVFAYDWSGSAWGNEQKLVASDQYTLSRFGWDLAISGDGTKLVVGAEREAGSNLEQGAVYAFSHNGTSWSEDEKIIPADVSNSDHFGRSVHMSTDGTRFVAGSGSQLGSVYVYDWSGSAWAQVDKLLPDANHNASGWGNDVYLTSDGNDLIVGNELDDEHFTNSGAVTIINTI